MTRLVVGLGNPGDEYASTRHNVGFRVVDRIAGLRGGQLFRSARSLAGYQGPVSFTWAPLEDLGALLVKPQTFMNRSGLAVEPLVRLLADPDSTDGPNLEQVMVVYDDLDLELGRLRIRPHGGAGGHNGMRSIIDQLSSDQFPRLKVGIGRADTDAARYVLGSFSPGELAEAEISVAEAAEAILDWLHTGDLQGCMTRFHSRWNPDT